MFVRGGLGDEHDQRDAACAAVGVPEELPRAPVAPGGRPAARRPAPHAGPAPRGRGRLGRAFGHLVHLAGAGPRRTRLGPGAGEPEPHPATDRRRAGLPVLLGPEPPRAAAGRAGGGAAGLGQAHARRPEHARRGDHAALGRDLLERHGDPLLPRLRLDRARAAQPVPHPDDQPRIPGGSGGVPLHGAADHRQAEGRLQPGRRRSLL